MQEIGPDDEIPEGFSCQKGRSYYRHFRQAENLLEYTIDEDRIYIDWIIGTDIWKLLKAVLDQERSTINTLEGYLTDKLEHAPDVVVERLGNRIARKLGTNWVASIERKEGQRFLVFAKEG